MMKNRKKKKEKEKVLEFQNLVPKMLELRFLYLFHYTLIKKIIKKGKEVTHICI